MGEKKAHWENLNLSVFSIYFQPKINKMFTRKHFWVFTVGNNIFEGESIDRIYSAKHINTSVNPKLCD